MQIFLYRDMFSTTISGSYRKYPESVDAAMRTFSSLGVQVLSPPSMQVVSSVDGFVSLQEDPIQRLDLAPHADLASLMRTVEQSHLQAIVQSDFLWLSVPEGYLGPSTAFELGWSLAHGVPVYALAEQIAMSTEPLLRMYARPVSSIATHVRHFDRRRASVDPTVGRYILHSLRMSNALNSTVAVGAIVEDHSRTYTVAPDLFFLDDGKWGGAYTLVGGKRKLSENLRDGLVRVTQSVGLRGFCEKHVCTFEEFVGAHYQERIFVDYVFFSRERVKKGVWMPGEVALRDLPLEPNAKETLCRYLAA